MNTIIHTQNAEGKPMSINIRCNGADGPNKHDSFAITGGIWSKLPKTDGNHLMGGCIHDEILAVRPDLKPFVELHLSDGDGVPMYAIENGWHWYCKERKKGHDYLRLSKEDAARLDKLIEDRNASQSQKGIFEDFVASMKPTWKAEADAAKKLLTELVNS